MLIPVGDLGHAILVLRIVFMMKNPFGLSLPPALNAPSSEEVAQRLLKGDAGAMMRRVARAQGATREPMPLIEDILTREDREGTEEMPLLEGEFTLTLPKADMLRSEDMLTAQGRPFELTGSTNDVSRMSYEEFYLTEQIVSEMGVEELGLRTMLLSIPQDAQGSVIARVVDVSECIDEKKNVHLDVRSISIVKFLRRMHERGYRPASCKELLAFARLAWRPDEGLEHSENGPSFHSPLVATLGSYTIGPYGTCFFSLNKDSDGYFLDGWVISDSEGHPSECSRGYSYLFVRN